MRGFGVNFRASMFFNAKGMESVLSRAERQTLSRLGAFIRRRARSSIRRRKRASEPGRPPSAHAPGSRGLKFILFEYSPRSHSVVVGPVRFSRGPDTPGLLEQGGVRTVERRSRRNRARVYRRTRANYAARPFMTPAMEAEAPKGPQLLRENLSRARLRRTRRLARRIS